jgi:hypothetical protein
MVTVVPLTVQEPLAVMTAVVLAFVVAVTGKLVPYGALVGAVRLAVGAIAAATVVVSVSDAER